MECEKLAQEKTEMQRHYVMVCLSLSHSAGRTYHVCSTCSHGGPP